MYLHPTAMANIKLTAPFDRVPFLFPATYKLPLSLCHTSGLDGHGNTVLSHKFCDHKAKKGQAIVTGTANLKHRGMTQWLCPSARGYEKGGRS